MSSHVPSDCPLCPLNGLVDIIAECDDAYLVEALGSPIPDCFLIIPRDHIEEITDLPATWQGAVSSMLQDVPWFTRDAALNLSFNVKFNAGQRLRHLHLWAIPRDHEDVCSPAYALGMASILQKANTFVSA